MTEDNKYDELFDRKIRSVLENGYEDVPAGTWEAISGKLDAAAPASGKTVRVIPLWTRILTGGAVAAAVTVGIFFSGPDPDSDMDREMPISVISENRSGSSYDSTPERFGIMLAKAEELPDFPERNAIPSGIPSSAGHETEYVPAEQNEVPVSVSVKKDETVSEGSADGSVDKKGHADESTEAEDEVWDRIIGEEENAKNGSRIRTSVTLSGNAISNSNSSSGTRDAVPVSFRPGKNEITKDKISESSVSSFGMPVSFGVGAKVEFAKRWAVSAGVNYSLLSRTFAGNFYKVMDDGSVKETYFSHIRNRQDYIGVPVNVYFSILRNDFIDFYATAGGTAEKCLSNRFSFSPEGNNFIHNEKAEGFQFSVNAGIGMEFIVARHLGIYIDPSLRYYFPDDRQPRSIRTVQPLMFGIELGLRVRL